MEENENGNKTEKYILYGGLSIIVLGISLLAVFLVQTDENTFSNFNFKWRSNKKDNVHNPEEANVNS